MGRQTPTGTTTVQIGPLGTATCLSYDDGVRNILGVPYGRLAKRWTRATLADSWPDNKHDGTKLGPRSHGIASHEASIDNDLAVPVPDHPLIPRPAPSELGCLNLNIALPPLPAGHDPNTLLPVIIYIHGGAFCFGSGGTANNDGAHFAGYSSTQGKPCIYVTINYRLGLGGFLASQVIKDELARDGFAGVGNFALTDQQLAVQWVTRYISHVGGDPGNVTLMGQSAGAASVGHLMLARGAEGDEAPGFQRAVLLSGAVDTIENWPLEMWEKKYQAVLRYFGIENGPDELEQLRRVPEVDVANATEDIDGGQRGVVMNLCADGWFHSPAIFSKEQLLNNPVLTKWTPPKWLKSLMVGDVRQEGLIWRGKLMNRDRGYDWYHNVLSQHVGSDDLATTILAEKYGAKKESPAGSEELSVPLENLCADVLFKIPVINMADKASQAAHSPAVYGYHFDRPSTADNVLKGLAHHSVDNIYGHLNALDIMTPEQAALAHRIADDWLDFAYGEKDPWDKYSQGGERKWMIYEPDDSWRVKSEQEDEAVRGYERMRWMLDESLYEKVYKAACFWLAPNLPYA
ncbi:Alpha/Beta hydrolase protein [Microdochium trichocladiopsis]|uniref:Alpha/Beta hydrolase protein n=1 Tax=Microdochium trichocladiopsis TaxID=1682393 RepID=A0A9P8XV19_9PEZI|nr:Alpha/Beta hydrolase protein [Microdochium trichocladiopsis]KAH7014278.1 Alpha/Beta hydrolase protein [Microdochium trichocladiopsis]